MWYNANKASRDTSRSREGAWIEIKGETNTVLEPMGSLPRGSVD